MSKCIVTGGLGLIGSHLVEELLKSGHQVVVIDDLSTGTLKNLAHINDGLNLKIINDSILDSKVVREEMQEAQFCYHLAASLGVSRILTLPISSYIANIHGSETVIAAASEYGVKVFFASTSEIYGKNPKQPLSENFDRVLGSPLNIRWAYSEAKALDESLLQMYRQEKGLDFVIGRFFNTVGPRQTGEYGMVLPRFVQAALKNEEIQVFGDGEQTRVFCHVRDSVEAVIRLLEDERAIGEAFNIGGEGEISINALALRVKEMSGSKSIITHVPYTEAYSSGFEETFRRVPDTRKLRELTGWKPRFELDEIINDVIDYYRASY